MSNENCASSEEVIAPDVEEAPVPEVINTVIETYVVTKEGPLKLAGFHVRVDNKEKSPLRRLIESE